MFSSSSLWRNSHPSSRKGRNFSWEMVRVVWTILRDGSWERVVWTILPVLLVLSLLSVALELLDGSARFGDSRSRDLSVSSWTSDCNSRSFWFHFSLNVVAYCRVNTHGIITTFEQLFCRCMWRKYTKTLRCNYRVFAECTIPFRSRNRPRCNFYSFGKSSARQRRTHPTCDI